MDEQPTGFLEEEPSQKSSMRLMCMFSLFAAIGFGVPSIIMESQVGLWITISFLVGAFAPKAVQKFAENEALFKK